MHSRDKEAFTLLATRYLSGEASSEERERLANDLKDPVCNEWFTSLQRGWDAAKPAPVAGFDFQTTSARIAREIARERQQTVARVVPRRHFTARFTSWFAVAALLALTITGTTLIVRSHREKPAATVAWTQRVTGLGERMTFTLQDGTKITLNGGSTLVYPAAFDHYTRIVRLTGEAFFDVTRDEARPFVVETSQLRTTVLGTHFNVTAFPGETASSVSLVEGRVQVMPLQNAKDSRPRLLSPGQQYVFTAATGEGQIQSFDSAEVIGWMHDVLVFNREPLASAAHKLSRRFGVPIKLAAGLSTDQTITGHFDKESLEEICEILRLTGALDFHLKQQLGHAQSVEFLPPRTDALPPP